MFTCRVGTERQRLQLSTQSSFLGTSARRSPSPRPPLRVSYRTLMARYFVTGGAGFIGSNLVDRLLADGHGVTAYDNLSTGQLPFLESARRSPNFRLVEGDLLEEAKLADAARGHDFVFHLAANADVRF